MTFLPIVDRELRVAARQPSSFWLRVVAAGVASLIGLMFLALDTVTFGTVGGGGRCFGLLAWLCLIGGASAGVFFTSDSLSEERREGTLGFLFLTDLRGYDVVLGKMAASTVRLLYGLLAVFPVMAVAFLMGGVTAGEFWLTLLALVNALLFSLAAGLAVSAWCRQPETAFGGTLALLAAAFIFLPLLNLGLANYLPGATTTLLSLASPFTPFVLGRSNTSAGFTSALLFTFTLTIGLLALASWKTVRGWRVVEESSPALGWKRGSRRLPPRVSLDAAPLEWLCHRLGNPGHPRILAALALLLPAWWVLGGIGLGFSVGLWVALSLVMELRIAMEAAQFMVEARQSGLLALLLAAPIRPEAIPLALGRALRRRFLLPVCCLLLVIPAGSLIVTTSAAVFNLGELPEAATIGIVIGVVNLMLATNFWAAGWFGMLMGLNSRNAATAVLKTFLFINAPALPFLMFCPMPPILMLKDLGLVGYARSELFRRLREAATGQRMNLLPPTPTVHGS